MCFREYHTNSNISDAGKNKSYNFFHMFYIRLKEHSIYPEKLIFFDPQQMTMKCIPGDTEHKKLKNQRDLMCVCQKK